MNFSLSDDASYIKFKNLSQKFFLNNSLNSTADLKAILEYLKLPSNQKSKNLKSLTIREYISNSLKNSN